MPPIRRILARTVAALMLSPITVGTLTVGPLTVSPLTVSTLTVGTLTLATGAARAQADPPEVPPQVQEGTFAEHVRNPPPRSNALRLQVSRLTLRGEGDYWPDKQLTFTGGPDDFEDLSFTFDYQRQLIGPFWAMLSLGVYEGEADQAYRDQTDAAGDPIVHTTRVERAGLTAGLLIYPIGREARISPYLGGGVGYYGWRLTEEGDFLNFIPDPPVIESERFGDEGDATGHYWIAGAEVPLPRGWAAFAEARWQRLTPELGGDFIGLGELDLASREVGAGLAVTF